MSEWAREQLGAAEAAQLGQLAMQTEKSKTMDDTDFMAALSRAFQDLDVPAEEGGDADDAKRPKQGE